MTDPVMAVPRDLLLATIDYLGQRPWREVNELIVALAQAEELQPAPEPEP